MNSTPQSNAKKLSLKSRLQEITKIFSVGAKEVALSISRDQLAERLYARAPHRFLSLKSNHDLASITDEAYAILTQFLQHSTPIIVNAANGRGIIAVLRDRPFIVSSIVEAASKNGIDIATLLHPIVTVETQKISLNYIEPLNPNVATLEQLHNIARKTIESVCLATDDFEQMKSMVEETVRATASPHFKRHYAHADNQEVSQFFSWLLDDSFVIVGTSYWDRNTASNSISLAKGYGLLSVQGDSAIRNECSDDAARFLEMNQPLWISRLSMRSPVLRSLPLIHIYAPDLDAQGTIKGVFSLVGIFSSKGINADATTVKLIRAKAERLVLAEEASIGSHDHKFILDTIDRMPKEEAIRFDVAGLQEIIEQTIDVYSKNDCLVTLRYDASGKGATLLVILPVTWFSEEAKQSIKKAAEKYLKISQDCIEEYLDLSAHGIARMYLHIPNILRSQGPDDLSPLQDEIRRSTKSWDASFASEAKRLSFEHADKWQFNESYKALYLAHEAVRDIEVATALTAARPLRLCFKAPSGHDDSMRVDVYSLEKNLTLSAVIPKLEHAGFEVLKDVSCFITSPEGRLINIHRFSVQSRTAVSMTHERFDDCLGPGLEQVLLGEAEDDILSSLMLTAHLNIRCVLLLRTYTSLLWQLNILPRKHQIREALAANPKIALKFWELFEYKFNPARPWSLEERAQMFEKSKLQYQELVKEEKDILKDKTLRALLSLLQHTVRTNFFSSLDIIAIKVNSKAIEFLPEPKPWMEIFIHSRMLEGCHLRSGPVSRGGIRWSERPDDFRTEVLGLVKTQKIKNVFIVPEGAKGGFVMRTPPSDPSQVGKAVEESYRTYIRTLLSLADNRLPSGKVVHPAGIQYDGLDPYFVVAADKGTASFSDVANKIASGEFQYWLDDAFASGGSNGYDHKLYGITAKGAWECVVRHFHDIGLNYRETPFTVIGIGDMSGDVFGNGLILSDKAKLVAAFNHKHIFLDPDPDPKVSFDERLRLFNLGRSQWADYNADLISRGGGIFERSSKEIPITPEVRQALGLGEAISGSLSGEDLINAILKAPVDLLWNGGIGTYVKATNESHMQVNDSANDLVRVSASELRCRVVGEGGNLGFSQRARVEFASRGGRLNSDAIDNSGGVGLSDAEVNIKILFSELLRSKTIAIEERNTLLRSMAEEVCEKVLQHNRNHAYRLSVSSERSVVQHEYFKIFMNQMIKAGYLNRELDCLPQEDELHERLAAKSGLYRPELAVCLAASKMWVKNILSQSKLIQDGYVETLLLDYFPKTLQERFHQAILSHPLRTSIIATQLTNELVNVLGISFLYRATITENLDTDPVFKASLATLLIVDAKKHIAELQKLDNPNTASTYIKIRAGLEQGLRHFATWIMKQAVTAASLSSLIDDVRPKYLQARSSTIIDADAVRELVSFGLPLETAQTIALLQRIGLSLEVAYLAERISLSFEATWSLYQTAMEKLGMVPIRSLVRALKPQNRWELSLRKASVRDIERGLSRIIERAHAKNITTAGSLAQYISASPSFQPLHQSVQELTNISFGLPHLALIARQIRDFSVH